MSETLIAALVAVGGALVAAVIAFEGVRRTVKASSEANERLAKVSEQNNLAVVRSSCESKIAEMRVHWNDDLRISLAKFGAAIASAVSAISMGNKPEDGDKQYWYVYIVLKLNQNDPAHRGLIGALSSMMLFVNDALAKHLADHPPGGRILLDSFERLFSTYSERSTAILKQEWDRAKNETRDAWTNPKLGGR